MEAISFESKTKVSLLKRRCANWSLTLLLAEHCRAAIADQPQTRTRRTCQPWPSQKRRPSVN